MRLNINLATRPYQDLGRFTRRWVPGLALFVIGSLVLLAFAWHQYDAGRDISQKIGQTQDRIHKLDQEKSDATKLLNDSANKGTADTSRFLNTLIARKSFSWTRAFMQLEEIMPERLHVVAMAPELTKDNQLQLLIRVGGDSHEKAVELVRRMEKSASFKSAVLRSEAQLPPDQAKAGDTVVFEINAVYVPNIAPAAKRVKSTTEKPDAATEEDSGEKPSAKPAMKGAKP